MTPERWKKIEEIFSQAIELPKTERTQFLQRTCADDSELLAELQSLLQQDYPTGTLMGTVISHAAGSLSESELKKLEGRHIGPYRITGLIGQGGMAEVYSAIRDDDQYQKQVAIKLIRNPGAAFLIKRFQHERQILASLEHPCIARFLEGGTTEDGIPYLVMEYIEGEQITTYCINRNLNLRARLQLFRSVCDAVQYAHRNLVIHRDLKPSNILVTSEGVPKLLDFGIAKLLNPEWITEAPTVGHTVTAIRIMTPEYASPEQIYGENVTTSTDVYSLGIILYELLTGIRPRDFKTKSLAGIERIITEEEPEKPSLAVVKNAAAAESRPIADTKKLRRELAQDLDNIVMMAIRKEPQRRYLSAEQFGADIDSYLQGRPIRARTPTLSYRAAKFIGRHRIGVSVTVVFIIFALIFVAGILRERSRAEQARVRAEREAARAKAVTEFLQDTFRAGNPFRNKLGRDVSLIEALQNAAKDIGTSFKNQPETEADIRNTVGYTFMRLGKYEDAEKNLLRALEIRRKLHTGNNEDIATSLDNMGTLNHEKGSLPQGEKYFREALAMRKNLYPEGNKQVSDTLNNLGVLVHDEGKLPEAEKLYRECLELRYKFYGPEADETASTINNLGALLIAKEDFAAAETMMRQVLKLDLKRWGNDHPNVAFSMNNLAYCLEKGGKINDAAPLYRKVSEMNPRLLGPEHPITTRGMCNLGRILMLQGNLKEAEPVLRKALEIQKRIMEPNHPQTANTLMTLAQALQRKNQCTEAEPLFRDAITIFTKSNYDPGVKAITISFLGDCLTTLHRFPEAEKLLIEGHSTLLTMKGAQHNETKLAQARLDHLYDVWKK
ncbi:MAG TPA: serine/threonine-protein kinase [Acidobacteriota bacterium]|nr:serine/threonine-protein kinase [Acidobacteriota bacterium]